MINKIMCCPQGNGANGSRAFELRGGELLLDSAI